MKNWAGKLLLSCLMCAIGITAVLTGIVYFNYMSEQINQDSTVHLEEIYGQVNRSFGAFVEENWGLLDSWGENISMMQEDDSVPAYISEKKEAWGFSDFYFLSSEMDCMTPDGAQSSIVMDSDWDRLLTERQPVMAGERLPDGKDVTVFAVPVTHREYQGFGYDAIAVSYTNADLAASLDVTAFSGKSRCFVIHEDGSVLLSTQNGGNVFDNYLTYLDAASDLEEEQFSQMKRDWHEGTSGLIRCHFQSMSYCILYQPLGYQDYIMLCIVPQSAVSAGFLSVQKTTANVLLVVFLAVGISALALFLIRSSSQSRRSRLELQYRERMFDVLSGSVDDIFIMLGDAYRSVDYVSPNIERLLGIPVEEARRDIRVMEKCAVGDNVLIPKEELDAIPLHGSSVHEYEYMHQHTGERRWYRMTVYHMQIQEMTKYIIVLSDRTQERQMNQKLQEALTAARSANEAKSNFLSNMSHDIRTPMNAIVGFSVLLEKDADKPDKVREYTRKITASSHHLLSLINDVLDMSKIESGKTSLNVEQFCLPELLEELHIILLPQAKAKHQDLRIHVQGAPPEQLVGDKLRLNQILLNLLSNAIKYTPEDGHIDFLISELSQKTPQYARLRFVVKDDGIGISEEFQKHIFSPFSREINSVTNKIQGTGLGMAITKNLVDLMGGIIRVESEPGKGSTFTVEMSFLLAEQDDTEQWFRQKIHRVLVADDEKDICTDIQRLLGEAGVEVVYETDGAAAVETAVHAHETGADFDVILLDWKMPGLDGVQTARSIREQIKRHVPILVLTSHDWSDIEDEARRAGINAFLSKPFFASSFWLTLKPMFEAEETAAPESPEENIMQGKLFLVAEDNELNAEILTEMLHIEGAECEVAVNGQEAVERFLNAEPGHFDMILMDVQMPVMNGYDATRQIRSSSHPEARTIPIAAMTANTFAEDVRNAIDAGMDGHLAKPIDMAAVRELTAKLLRRQGAETPAQDNKGGSP